MSTSVGKTLLIGEGGMLGRAFRAHFETNGIAFEGVDLPAFDLSRPGDAQPVEGFERVVCCAAYTDVDGAESDEERARAVNGEGVARLAAACREFGATLVHFGTDYVFAGDATAPYAVDTARDPLNAYGRSKAAGELALEASKADYLHVRTSWLYAPWGKNFVLTMAKLTHDQDSLTVVDDQRGRPTSARHLARASLALADSGMRGVAHVCDGGECTWFELACHVRDVLGNTCAIEACDSSAFPRPAKRPHYSVLDLSRTEACIGAMPDWRDNVRDALLDVAERK